MAQVWVFFSHWLLGGTWTDTEAGAATRTGTDTGTGTVARTDTEAGTGTEGETSVEGCRKDNLVVVEEKVVLVIVEVLVKIGEEGDESKEEDVEDGTGGEKYRAVHT